MLGGSGLSVSWELEICPPLRLPVHPDVPDGGILHPCDNLSFILVADKALRYHFLLLKGSQVARKLDRRCGHCCWLAACVVVLDRYLPSLSSRNLAQELSAPCGFTIRREGRGAATARPGDRCSSLAWVVTMLFLWGTQAPVCLLEVSARMILRFEGK